MLGEGSVLDGGGRILNYRGKADAFKPLTQVIVDSRHLRESGVEV